MWHHNCSLWHHKTVFMTSHPHSSWHHTHCIQHDIHSTCDITATVTMTRHLLYFDITLSECDISNGEWMTTQWLYLTWYPLHRCNQTHLIDDITPYVRMKSHLLHIWHHRHFMWHHIHSCRQHTIVCMSWHTLGLWNPMHYKCCHPYCVYDYPSTIPGLKPVKTAISSTLYAITPSLLRHHTYCVRYHRWHMYAIICVTHDIISTLYDNSP